MELMNKHNLSLFHLEKEGVTIKLKKGIDSDDLRALMPPAAPVSAGQVAAASPSAESPSPAPQVEASNESEIASPMVGTMYRSPAPDAEPFVKVGDQVSEDTIVCIIEAMKVMNEIKAETHGVITKVLVDDGMPVQYGQPLFLVAPA